MRGAAALAGMAAVWSLARLPGPGSPRLRLPRIPTRALALACATGAIVAGLGLEVTGSAATAASLGGMAGLIPPAVIRSRERRKAELLAGGWPDFLASVRSLIATGRSLPESVVAGGLRAGGRFEELAERVADSTAGRTGFAGCLADLRREWCDPLADRVLITLTAAQRSGGRRVASVLSALANSVADELRLRRAHDAALTQQRLTASVALAAPWFLLVLSIATNPQAEAAYRTGTGAAVILGGLAATSSGFWLARRAARLSEPPRVFE